MVVLNAPAALSWRRAAMRIAGTTIGFIGAIGIVALIGSHAALALIIALVLLLPGLLLMPVNYGAAVAFITCMVGVLFAVSGEEADFLKFRVVDNLVGVAVVGAVGTLLWRTNIGDWWRAARRTALSLADAADSTDRASHRDELVTRALQLRTETVETAALPDPSPAFAAAWSFLAAAEDLMRMLLGLGGGSAVGTDVARELRAVAAQCTPDGPGGAGAAWAPGATGLAELEVSRMARAVAVLHGQSPGEGDGGSSSRL